MGFTLNFATGLILLLVFWLVPAYICMRIAGARGRSPQKWAFLSLFFGPIMLIAVLLLPQGRPTI